MLAATITLTSFTTDRLSDTFRPAEITARGLVAALRQSSETKFVALFPTLSDFLRQMDANQAFYGSNLEAAKAEFTETYVDELLPAVRRAYATLLAEAEKRGINWTDVNIQSVQILKSGFTISLEQGDKKFDILVEKALMIDGRSKVSQHVTLR